MNPTEDFSSAQKPSEDLSNVLKDTQDFTGLHSPSRRSSGFGRGKKYPGAEVPHPGNERGDHMIMEEAYTLFENQGERRSVRMIAEYCKNGELVCFYDSDDKRWHITRESVENKINKIKDLNARKAAVPPRSTSEHFSEDPAPPQRPSEEIPPRHESTTPPSEDIKKLEQEIFDLKVLNKSKDMYITQLIEDREKEREQLLVRIESSNRLVGRFKAKLLQLVAPRTTRDIDFLAAPTEPTPDPPGSNVSPDASLSDNTNDHYEYAPQEPRTTEQR